ncbi:flavin containing amine oxidoreductase [Nitzschia inconspicua]|uniref:Flavin containing amine oxidoreductase n=1 Tax=Nitzschia inconspicua TaxID=303405 RepID=A0A9K3L6C2_9STRA|nr:flavin containing amine oxidoreductase [Nitzschia inconspicua]
MKRLLSVAWIHSFGLVTAIIVPANLTNALSATKPPKKVVVIGGGWAGFSAADALSTISQPSSSDPAFEIEILDASPRGPGGLAAGWRTPKLQRPVEAGLHGFWREYRNTFAAMERIGLNLDEVLTPFTPSILVSSSGRVALAPVLGNEKERRETDATTRTFSPTDLLDPKTLTSQLAELLPPPLDIALLSDFESDNPLTTLDRLSGVGLLGAWADFEQENKESWERYDNISAENLFRSIAGVTPTLYNELVSPLLHVLPMTPAYDCSAAAALSCFHVFALQTRGAFDVRWCRGTITEKIFNPWTKVLQERGNVNLRGGAKVTSISELSVEFDTDSPKFEVKLNDGQDAIDCDAIIFAIGGTSLKTLTPSCQPLVKLPVAKKWQNFRGVTCVAVRLFFDSEQMILSVAAAMEDSPVVVCGANVGGIKELTETGFCIYDLERLQDGDDVKAALEVDFFRADSLATLSDEQVVRITLKAVAAALKITKIQKDILVDTSVVRARNAVSHFCVDSASWSPGVKLQDGLYICGDWIDRTGHASWSTEKSVVTGVQAAADLARQYGLESQVSVIPAAPDTPLLQALRQIARTARKFTPPGFENVKPQLPWMWVNQRLFGR